MPNTRWQSSEPNNILDEDESVQQLLQRPRFRSASQVHIFFYSSSSQGYLWPGLGLLKEQSLSMIIPDRIPLFRFLGRYSA